jgi:hypothetical protein
LSESAATLADDNRLPVLLRSLADGEHRGGFRDQRERCSWVLFDG